MSLEFSNEKEGRGEGESHIDYHLDDRWLQKIRKIYKLFLSDEICENRENHENREKDCRKKVNNFWLNDMRMPPILECYKRQESIITID